MSVQCGHSVKWLRLGCNIVMLWWVHRALWAAVLLSSRFCFLLVFVSIIHISDGTTLLRKAPVYYHIAMD